MKRNVRQKTVRKLIAIALILAAIYLFAGVAQQVYSTLQLRSEKKTVEAELEKLIAENERLIANKKKFEDPNYIVTYAHGAYMFSKEDEKVFYLPSADESEVVTTPSPVPTASETPAATFESETPSPSPSAEALPEESPAVSPDYQEEGE